MTDTQVTIVVVPRERFSYTSRSLQSIYENTDIPFSLVYVDGGSPARIRRYLAQKARQHNFKLIRTKRYLSPNLARNLGLQQVESKYVVFVDNDVLVSPGWLKVLVDCAEKTGAWVVSPLTLIGETGSQSIHAAGGTVNIKEERGQRVFETNHLCWKVTSGFRLCLASPGNGACRVSLHVDTHGGVPSSWSL